MGGGGGARRAAEAAARQSADEARALRNEVRAKEAREQLKIQRKFIKATKGKFYPFGDIGLPPEEQPQGLGASSAPMGTPPVPPTIPPFRLFGRRG